MNFHDYLLLLSAAFFASLSHCVGMCGGIVVGLNMRQFDSSKILQALANILYFFGRMCSYADWLMLCVYWKKLWIQSNCKGDYFYCAWDFAIYHRPYYHFLS